MNKSPHVVGGGLGTFRKKDTEAALARKKEEQRKQRIAAAARMAKSK